MFFILFVLQDGLFCCVFGKYLPDHWKNPHISALPYEGRTSDQGIYVTQKEVYQWAHNHESYQSYHTPHHQDATSLRGMK